MSRVGRPARGIREDIDRRLSSAPPQLRGEHPQVGTCTSGRAAEVRSPCHQSWQSGAGCPLAGRVARGLPARVGE